MGLIQIKHVQISTVWLIQSLEPEQMAHFTFWPHGQSCFQFLLHLARCSVVCVSSFLAAGELPSCVISHVQITLYNIKPYKLQVSLGSLIGRALLALHQLFNLITDLPNQTHPWSAWRLIFCVHVHAHCHSMETYCEQTGWFRKIQKRNKPTAKFFYFHINVVKEHWWRNCKMTAQEHNKHVVSASQVGSHKQFWLPGMVQAMQHAMTNFIDSCIEVAQMLNVCDRCIRSVDMWSSLLLLRAPLHCLTLWLQHLLASHQKTL